MPRDPPVMTTTRLATSKRLAVDSSLSGSAIGVDANARKGSAVEGGKVQCSLIWSCEAQVLQIAQLASSLEEKGNSGVRSLGSISGWHKEGCLIVVD